MKEDNRFEIVEKQAVGFSREALILMDKVTGVQYLYFGSGYGGGMTPLLDRDGKPIIGRRQD